MSRLGRLVLVVSAAVTLAGATEAQVSGRHVFRIEPTQSQFTFSGTINISGLGSQPLVGTPGNFRISGGMDADLTTTGGQLTRGQFVEGAAEMVVPTVRAEIPNPIPFLAPLATIRVTGVRAKFRSVNPTTLEPASFAISGTGNFTTSAVTINTAGSAQITALGSTTNYQLAGAVSAAQQISGTIRPDTGGIVLNAPVARTYPFNSSGTSGTIRLNGNIRGFDDAFAADVSEISVSAGGRQTMRLSGGTRFAGGTYVVLGSASGTQPGFSAGAVNIPLNFDGWMTTTLTFANQPPFGNTVGFLDAAGLATATFTLPPLPAALAGFSFNHAYITVNGSVVEYASNPIPVFLTP